MISIIWRKLIIFVLTLLPPPTISPRLMGLMVCLNTSETANMPIMIGIMSKPPRSSVRPKVNLAQPTMGSVPMVAMNRPSRPEIRVLSILSGSRQVRTLSPRKLTANSSDGPNFSPREESCGDSKNMAQAETTPPMAEQMMEVPSASPARP